MALPRLRARWIGALWLAGLSLFALGACTSNPDSLQARDPFEPFNRSMYRFNDFGDRLALKPAANAYESIAPEPARQGFRNFMDNLNQPVVFLNTALQGDFDRAGETLVRFGLNTTFGLAGLVDVASREGVPKHYEDFGQTMAVWGVESGPYLMLPFLGPSNFRDGLGRVADTYTHPINWQGDFSRSEEAWALRGMDMVDWRSRLDAMFASHDRTAIDPYVQLRSAWRQNRETAIRNGAAEPAEDLPDFE